jgi:signal transduction histidine kinase
VPSPYAPCGLDCPANAFMVVDAEPAFVDAWLSPLRDLLAVTIFAAVLIVLAQRFTRASVLMRRTLAPVLAAASLLAVFFIAYFLIRRISAGSPVLSAVGWLYVLSIPAIAVGFVVGLIRSQLAAGDALQRLVARLRDHPDPRELTAVLRETMDDPTLELVYWVPGRGGPWVDADGISVPAHAAGSRRSLTEVRDGDRLVAGLVHDAALSDQWEFVEAAGSIALATLENQRLTAEVDASLLELSESRARIQAAADSERRRIERDLHDGAQQRLVALRVRLGLAGELLREDPERGTELLGELGSEAEDALEEVRALAHGVYPSLLADHGLGEAVRALARRIEPHPRVGVEGVGRYEPEVESAVYFCCLEALQNVAKHAEGASSVAVSVTDDGELRFEVHDDGPGLSGDAEPGTGLTNMKDRLAAVGGELVIRSGPGGGGIQVIGRIPSPRRTSEESA